MPLVVSSGAPGHAQNFADMMGWSYTSIFGQPLTLVPTCFDQPTVFIGMFPSDLALFLEVYFRPEPVFPIFIGSDVLHLQRLSEVDSALFSFYINSFRFFQQDYNGKIAAVSPNLVDELSRMGVQNVSCIPLLPKPPDAHVLSGEGVGVYVPQGAFKRGLFNLPYVERYLKAHKYPLVFHVDSTMLEQCPLRTDTLWYTDNFEEFADSIAVNIRLTIHDGLPQSVVALAQRGIPTITTSANKHFAQGELFTIPVEHFLFKPEEVSDRTKVLRQWKKADKCMDRALSYLLKDRRAAEFRAILAETSRERYAPANMISLFNQLVGVVNG